MKYSPPSRFEYVLKILFNRRTQRH